MPCALAATWPSPTPRRMPRRFIMHNAYTNGLRNDALIQLFAMHQQKNDFSSGSVNRVPPILGEG